MVASLPSDAKAYVVKLIALATILKDPQRFNIALPFIANEPFFTTYALRQTANLHQIAHVTETNIETIRRLNPGYGSASTIVPKVIMHCSFLKTKHPY